MISQNHLDKSMLTIFAVALLMSACSPAVNWDYPRTPSNTFAHPETTTVGALFHERGTALSKNIRTYPGSLLFDKAVPRSWPGWRWPT